MVGRYQEFPLLNTTGESSGIRMTIRAIQQWSDAIIQELESRDTEINDPTATRFYSVATVSDIGRPTKGDVAYSRDSNVFYGYTSVGAVNGWAALS